MIELRARRTFTTKSYMCTSDAYETKTFEIPVHYWNDGYENAHNDWEKSHDGGSWDLDRVPVQVSLPIALNGSCVLRFCSPSGESTVKLSFEHEPSFAQYEKDHPVGYPAIVYPNAFGKFSDLVVYSDGLATMFTAMMQKDVEWTWSEAGPKGHVNIVASGNSFIVVPNIEHSKPSIVRRVLSVFRPVVNVI